MKLVCSKSNLLNAVNIVSKGHMGSYLMGKDYKLLVAISIVYGIILFIIYIFRNKIIKDDIKDE